jgi:2-C-methyl-D-erythritol 4-phosphate cytidylyltransferase
MVTFTADTGDFMDAILLAAGSSRRMGSEIDKQLVRLGGKPVMIFSLERLVNHAGLSRVIVTSAKDNLDDITELLEDYHLSSHCVVVEGGSTRQESVVEGLKQVTSERVLIHEGARPLIDNELIDRVLAVTADCAVPTIQIPFTVAVGGSTMENELDRSLLHNVQLPQVFNTDVIRKAHERAMENGETATEDSVLVHRMGYEVIFVEGSKKNIKITYPEDLVIAETLIFGEG